MTTTTILSLALAGLFGATAAGKLADHSMSLEMRDHLAVPAARWKQIGLLEVAGAGGALLGLEVPQVGIAAAAGLGALSLGAIATHLRAGDKPSAAAPAVVGLALSIATATLQATTF
jgi:hypothetical protein